ncbi:hypothetical protein [Hyphomicrobium sp.]|uniref:hypothetical protein n=1 Tax=Hyphomicrobium sp. TaxID=82 RepID=UPI002E374388|nr:hypothetical protein [Hyphomicrobium sp.]HEX2842115.1 hypothetical protein [Hyphomicrobium sp.]
MGKPDRDCETALKPPWSLEEYERWQRDQEERDEAEREAVFAEILTRDDPECEAAVKALEEAKWGRSDRVVDR